jgi:hypothetical protein
VQGSFGGVIGTEKGVSEIGVLLMPTMVLRADLEKSII